MQDIAETYMNLLLKKLNGEVLSLTERSLLADVQAVDDLMPGMLEEEILRCSLGPIPARSSLEPGSWTIDETIAAYGVAAETGSAVSAVYVAVLDAVNRGEHVYCCQLGAKTAPVLDIMAERHMVAPKYVPGYEFVLERLGQSPQTVGQRGGIFIDFDELSKMELECDQEGKTIRLRSI